MMMAFINKGHFYSVQFFFSKSIQSILFHIWRLEVFIVPYKQLKFLLYYMCRFLWFFYDPIVSLFFLLLLLFHIDSHVRQLQYVRLLYVFCSIDRVSYVIKTNWHVKTVLNLMHEWFRQLKLLQLRGALLIMNSKNV